MKTYFKICSFSPIWLPLLLIGLLFVMRAVFGGEAVIVQVLQGLCFWSGAALVFGGIQYLIAMTIVWRRIDFDSVESVVRGCFALPIVFTPIQLLPFLLWGVLNGGGLNGLLGLAGLDLLFGYGYVLLWFLGYWLYASFRKLRGRAVTYG